MDSQIRWSMRAGTNLPEVFCEQLDEVAKNIVNNRMDGLIVLIGAERIGKSMLSSIIGLYMQEKLHATLEIKRDYAYDQTDFIDGLFFAKYLDNPNNENAPKKGGLHYIKIYDEPVMGANARKWGAEGNLILNQSLAIIGYKYHFMMASIPNFFMLDNVVREHRVSALLKVSAVIDEEGWIQKGYFSVYNATAVKKIYKDQKTKRIIYPHTKFEFMPFNSIEGTQFWKEYELFSSNAKQQLGNDLVNRNKKLRNERQKKLTKGLTPDEQKFSETLEATN